MVVLLEKVLFPFRMKHPLTGTETIVHDRGMEVVETILDLYPEIDKTKRNILLEGTPLNPETSPWSNGVVVFISQSRYGIICRIELGENKIRQYSISAVADLWNNHQDLIEKELKEKNISDKRHAGSLHCNLYQVGTITGPEIEETFSNSLLYMVLARQIAAEYIKYGFNIANLGSGNIELFAHDLKQDTIENFVKAVRKYDLITSSPNFKNAKDTNKARLEDDLKKLIPQSDAN